MKITLPFVFSILQGAAATKLSPIAADSRAGIALLSKSRLLEDQDQNNNDDDGYTWMQNYSLKFLGCHHVAHWNSDAQDEEDVKIQIERHVRYRLCPSSSCSSNTALGCTSGFGDYIVDMDTFLQGYIQNKKDIEEAQCETRLNQCNCGGDDDQYDEEKCEYNCYNDAGMSQCIDKNPYYDDAQQQEQDDFELEDYTYCTEYNADGNADNEDRRLRLLDQEEVQYFLGPYCADKGDEINLGLFTDDTCTEFADSAGGANTFYSTFGSAIPYHGDSLIDNSCYTCKMSQYYEDDETREVCSTTYDTSGKCESKLSEDVVAYPNENSCSYIEGIKILKHSVNGVVYREYHGTKKAAIAISFFATTFIVLAFYVCYLRNRVYLAMKAALLASAASSNSPNEKRGFFRTIAKNLSPKSVKRRLSFNRGSKKKKEDALI